MPFQFKEIRGYLKRHKYYLPNLIRDILKLFWWRICGKRIAVITIGSGGVGDYLWIRNYMPLVKEQGYNVILIAMAHWKEIVETFDKENVDIIRYFESCLSPKRIETLFFKLFKADVFLNFRQISMGPYVRTNKEYNDSDIPKDTFYEEKNNIVFSQFTPLPDGIKHTLPIIPPSKDNLKRPFAILVERGNTQGSLSINQSLSIIKCLTSKGYHILINGDKERLAPVLDSNTLEMIADGSQFTFPQYTYLVNECSLVVTVNTSIYHFALQLQKACIVISANEYETIKLNAPKQIIVFNKDLQIAYEKGNLQSYRKKSANKIETIESKRIVDALNEICNIII